MERNPRHQEPNNKEIQNSNFQMIKTKRCKKGDEGIHPAGITDGNKMNFMRQYRRG
jgi:hypothetical protein